MNLEDRITRIERILEEHFGLSLVEESPREGPTVEEIQKLYCDMGYSYKNAKRQARRDHHLRFSLEEIKEFIEAGRRKEPFTKLTTLLKIGS